MNHPSILNNKENENTDKKHSINLRINYQDSYQVRNRQKIISRSKSPLNQDKYKQRYQYTSKQRNRSPLTSSNLNSYGNYRYVQQSHVQAFDVNKKFINRQPSNSDLFAIKPISLENQKSKLQYQRNRDKTQQQKSLNKPNQNQNDNQLQNDKKMITKSSKVNRTRQNSKHLQFSAKVNNLEKITSQISSLLSYVNQKRLTKKDQPTQKIANKSYKHRYQQNDNTSKSYKQRRLSALQKPVQEQPQISIFNIENQQHEEYKRDNRKYDYSNDDEIYKKSPKFNSNYDQQKFERKTPASRSANRVTQISQKQLNLTSKSIHKEQISSFPSIKSQQMKRNLIQSESEQKFSKVTNQNPDLEFYYESLKKRDQQIDKFKKKLFDSLSNKKQKNENKFSRQQQKNENKLYEHEQKYNHLQHQRNDQKNRSSSNYSPSLYKNKTDKSLLQRDTNKEQKNDIFISQNQIEAYKDISRLNSQHSTSSIRRMDRYAYKNEKNRQQEQYRNNQNRQNRSSTDLLSNQITEKKTSTNKTNSRSYQNFSPLRQESNKIEPALTTKLDQQIKKIKNQLKDCKNQKSYLRSRYGNLLQNFNSKQVHTNKNNSNSSNFYKQNNRQNNDQRMYESSTQKEKLYHQNFYEGQNYNQELRKKIVKQNKQGYSKQNQAFSKEKSRPTPQRSPMRRKSQLYIQTYQGQKIQNQIIQSSKYSKKSNVITPKSPHKVRTPKNFQIQLHKVQITKPQTTKLGTMFAQNIQLDLKLREQREKFIKNQDPCKWKKLREELNNEYRLNKSQQQWQDILAISPEQHNPFSPSQQSTGDIHNLCFLISKSFEFFEKNLLHKFSSVQLKKQKFSFQELDLSMKGYLSLEDLICFVNLHSGKFYRNRDIIFMVKCILSEYGTKNDFTISPKEQRKTYDLGSDKKLSHYKLTYEFLWNLLVQ